MQEKRSRLLRVATGVTIFLLVQVGWFACVLGAARGLYWLGPIVVAVLLFGHLAMSRDRLHELRLIVAFGLAGTAIDSGQACLGLLEFRGALFECLAPPWIIALWFHFGTNRQSLFEPLAGRWWLAALLGAIGGPMAYGAGVRLGAASFPQPFISVLSIGLIWGAVLATATWWTGRREQPTRSSKPQGEAT